MSTALLGLALAVGAPALKDKAAPEPTLVGEWAAESVTVSGRPAPPGADRWVFHADGTMSILNRGQRLDTRHYMRGPAGRPRALDLAPADGMRPTDLAVYRIAAGTLTVSVGHDPAARPIDLGPGPTATVWVFKRVQDK